MKVARVLAGVLLAVVLTSGSALAAYRSSGDTTVSVTLLPGLVQTSSTTGALTFELQEATHNTLSSTTGTSVDHCYVWVEVNGQQVLAVDPLWIEGGK
jgi:hypothetical protein